MRKASHRSTHPHRRHRHRFGRRLPRRLRRAGRPIDDFNLDSGRTRYDERRHRSAVVNKGLYTGNIAYNAAARTLIRTDGSSWLDDGFLEGQTIKITGFAGIYKINTISGTAANRLDKITLTGQTALPSSGTGELTVTQWAAVATFTPANWYVPMTVNLLSDTWFVARPGTREHQDFRQTAAPAQRHARPAGSRGGHHRRRPLAATRRSLAIRVQRPIFNIAPQPPEAQQVDVLNLYGDSSMEDLTGEVTATAITGFDMAGELDFRDYGLTSSAYGEALVIPGGISYGRITVDPSTGNFVTDAGVSTIEVINLLLGQGNDRLDILSTLVPVRTTTRTARLAK